MERNKIIIIGLVIVIIALLVCCVVMMQTPQKEATKLKITSNNTINEGENITVKLTTLNGSAISDESVNITITSSDGTAQYFSVVTNNNGIANLKLKDAGNYTVNCTYGGNENYTGNTTTMKLEVKEEVVEVKSPSNTQYSSSSSSKSSSDDYGPAVDSSGITREQAKKYGYRYTTAHGGHYIGSHDRWDEKAGVYHD